MPRTTPTAAAAAAALALALAAFAGAASGQTEIVQARSDWYTNARVQIEVRLQARPNTNRARNVILFVADGLGVGTNYAVRLFDGQQKGMLGEENVLPYETYPNTALVKTYNINAQTPDSAPTAGAMNTGVKQRFNLINLSEAAVADDCATEAGNKLSTFAEIVSGDMDKSVGIVSTARLTHATPAAVYARTASRDWEDSVPAACETSRDIATQLIDAMKSGLVDVALGGGRRGFLPESVQGEEGDKGRRKDGANLIEAAKAAGAQYLWNDETASRATLDGTPILGLFEDSHMKFEPDRTGEPSLTEMTELAIMSLQTNGNGFYLQVEAGRVDHANHDGNAYRALADGVEFARAVARADALTEDSDTLIVVTADHGHAIAFNGYCGRGTPILGLCMDIAAEGVKHSGEPVLAADGKPYTVIGYLNGPGSVLRKQADGSHFGTRPILTQAQATDPEHLQGALIPMFSETHSGEDVIAWAKGPWSHLMNGTVEQHYIFHVMLHAARAE